MLFGLCYVDRIIWRILWEPVCLIASRIWSVMQVLRLRLQVNHRLWRHRYSTPHSPASSAELWTSRPVWYSGCPLMTHPLILTLPAAHNSYRYVTNSLYVWSGNIAGLYLTNWPNNITGLWVMQLDEPALSCLFSGATRSLLNWWLFGPKHTY